MKPEINWDSIFEGAGNDARYDVIEHAVTELRDRCYETGRNEVLTLGPARVALLEGQAYWLDVADRADGEIGRVVARTIADAFHEWADAYRPVKATEEKKKDNGFIERREGDG